MDASLLCHRRQKQNPISHLVGQSSYMPNRLRKLVEDDVGNEAFLDPNELILRASGVGGE